MRSNRLSILKEFVKMKKNKYQLPISKSTETWYGKFFPPNQEDVYSIEKWYADAPVIEGEREEITHEEDGLVGLELRIFLSSSDWYKFQKQPFCPELIQYLDSLKIQKDKKQGEEGDE